MQTFLPYPEYDVSAIILDSKRLGNQRKECMQIINVLTTLREEAYGKKKKAYIEQKGTIVPWSNHPAVLMWKDNVYQLFMYLKEICKEWVRRGHVDAQWDAAKKILNNLKVYVPFDDCNKPFWLGDDAFHLSHQSNLLRKDERYYSKYFNVPNDLPYVWPVRSTAVMK